MDPSTGPSPLGRGLNRRRRVGDRTVVGIVHRHNANPKDLEAMTKVTKLMHSGISACVWRLLAVAVGVVCVHWSYGQGTLNFNNNGSGLVLTSGCESGLTGFPSPWLADLYFGAASSPECLLIPLHDPAEVKSSYFQGGVKTIPNYGPGTTLTAQVRFGIGRTGSIGITPYSPRHLRRILPCRPCFKSH